MSGDVFRTSLRSHQAGALRAADAGTSVTLAGWVHRSRNLGGLVFLDLRDRAGLVQVSFDTRWSSQEMIDKAASLGQETVVRIEGTVELRPTDMRNAELQTGDVEVHATSIYVLGPAETPAIPVARGKGEKLASEDLRLRHRHLDLRRPELQANIVLRHRLQQSTRRYLDEHGYLEIETPILTKPTPEGARDYLVPSRVHAGEFYALPQSPQLYKQLLMVAGFDRYFQIARCFRDEDLRADRQPEFTQIDIEASFVTPEDIMAMAEGLLAVLFADAGVSIPAQFRRMTYAQCMEQYGCDRPDLRYGMPIVDATDAFRNADFGITRSAIDAGGRIRGIKIPGGAGMSRKQVDEIELIAKSAGAFGLLRLKKANGALEGPVAKFLDEAAAATLGLDEGDLMLMVAGKDEISSTALDRVRQDVAKRLDLVPEGAVQMVWVTDFPLFGVDSETGGLAAVHHPFTAPNPEDVHMLESDPRAVRALAYDVVMNGTELGGGSIRMHDPAMQKRVLGKLGVSEDDMNTRFGFLLEGLRAGAPPHGGIAFGFDRIAMLLSGAPSLRDVIAFPKTTAARALCEGAPTPVNEHDLHALHLEHRKSD
ncbi:MAG TPA: aspartate--tRNA ligase [Gemmatimonadaceae bacterium]|nr:aspartate--tRNA ligase [Gemmatimonadaceae bacterium]